MILHLHSTYFHTVMFHLVLSTQTQRRLLLECSFSEKYRSCRNDFKNYANLCFRLFGDRVKHWITFNEPCTFIRMGYVIGTYAPGRCSPWMDDRCSLGDSGREPYIVAHHQLLAHAITVKLYRDKYQVIKEPRDYIAYPMSLFAQRQR